MALKLSFSPCAPEDMSSDDVMSIMTPKVKRDITSLFMEDSSQEINDQKLSRDSATPEIVSSRRTLFGKSRKRSRKDSEESPAHKDRPQKRSNSLRRALSLGDSPLKPKPSENFSHDVVSVVNKFAEDSDLVGDCSGSHSLPTIPGKHSDLKSISSQTMSDLLKGKYNHCVNSYRIIDCRYPYEFQGGHIEGAENLYTHEQIQELLKGRHLPESEAKRDILIFHCEFSSERGPKMMRFLRKQDRTQNQQSYPALCYPEIYLLDKGYKAFYFSEESLCSPVGYTPMLHKDHSEDLRHFRTKSKSWTAGEKRKQAKRMLRI